MSKLGLIKPRPKPGWCAGVSVIGIATPIASISFSPNLKLTCQRANSECPTRPAQSEASSNLRHPQVGIVAMNPNWIDLSLTRSEVMGSRAPQLRDFRFIHCYPWKPFLLQSSLKLPVPSWVCNGQHTCFGQEVLDHVGTMPPVPTQSILQTSPARNGKLDGKGM